MFERRFTLSKSLYEKVEEASQALGCASVKEFVERTLEMEADKILSKSEKSEVSEEEANQIAEKLKGLGYIE